MAAFRTLFSEILQQMLREARRVLGQRNHTVNAFDIVGLSLQEAVCERARQFFPIGRLTQATIADPHAGGLNNQVPLLSR
jgi:hypothetical protein